MPDYRLLFGEPQTYAAQSKVAGTLRGELPVESATATESLNAAGKMTAVASLDVQGQIVDALAVTRSNLAVARTSVYLERDHEIRWAGLLWTVDADLGSQQLTLGCEGFHSFFKRRVHPKNLTLVYPVATEQFEIGWDFIIDQHIGGRTHLGIEKGAGASGVLRGPGNYDYQERKTYGDMLEELAALDNGFDFRYRTIRDPSTEAIRTFLDFTYPNTGTATNYFFEVGANCALLTYSEDGTTIINDVDFVGAGGLPVSGNNTDASALNYPQLFGKYEMSDVTSTVPMVSRARFELIRGREAMKRLTLAVPPTAEPVLGTYKVGDRVRVRSEYGWATFDETFRIMEQTLNVAGGSEEMVTLALVSVVNFDNTAGITVTDYGRP